MSFLNTCFSFRMHNLWQALEVSENCNPVTEFIPAAHVKCFNGNEYKVFRFLVKTISFNFGKGLGKGVG